MARSPKLTSTFKRLKLCLAASVLSLRALMLVCHCRKVFDRDIRTVARETGSLAGVCRRSGAGTCCGGCVPLIRDIVVQESRKDAERPSVPVTGTGVAALCR